MQVTKALVQATMLSGRYRCGSLTRYWINSYDGHCLLKDCGSVLEDISHILTACPALHGTRGKLAQFTWDYSLSLPGPLCLLLRTLCHPTSQDFCQFLLDPSVIPAVIRLSQLLGRNIFDHLFYISRTWVYALHRERLKQLGLWKRYSG